MGRDRRPFHAANGKGRSKPRCGRLRDIGEVDAALRLLENLLPVRNHRSPQKRKSGNRFAALSTVLREKDYFRLLMAVRSAESLAMPAAPHQFEPAPPGLIGVMLVVPDALKALVKALQLPFERFVSE